MSGIGKWFQKEKRASLSAEQVGLLEAGDGDFDSSSDSEKIEYMSIHSFKQYPEPESCWSRVRSWMCCQGWRSKCDAKTKEFWTVISLLFTVLFVGEAARGMIVPSLYLYVKQTGGTTKELGIVVAAFSLGRLLSSVPLGWWFNKRGAKDVLIACLLLNVIANFAYSLAALSNWWVILISRFVVGFGSGTLSVVRAGIAAVTTSDQRTRYFAWSAAVQYIGFAVVPGVGSLLSLINFHIGRLPVDHLTSPGYVLSLTNLVVLVLVIFLYPKQAPVPESEEKKKPENAVKIPIETLGQNTQLVPQKIVTAGILTFIVLNFVARGVLSVLEVTGSPVFLDVWDPDNSNTREEDTRTTSNMLLALGCAGIVAFFLIDPARKWISEQAILTFSFVVITVGSVLLINYGNFSVAQFLAGATLIWSIGSPISQTLIISAFSKILGSKPQGTMMGWIGSAGSVGRIIFPTLCGYAGNNWSFFVSAITAAICAVAVVVYTYIVKRVLRRQALINALPEQ